MGYFADIYVIKKTRSKKLGISFLNHFLPTREESCDDYEVVKYGENTTIEFNEADSLMDYCEENIKIEHSIYWRNKDDKNLNRHGMIFYTIDSYMIFGISRNHNSLNSTENEELCLTELKDFFKTEEGYITYECIPEETYSKFIDSVKNYEERIN